MAGRIVPSMINCWYGCGHTEVFSRGGRAIMDAHVLMEIHYDKEHKEDLDSITAQFDSILKKD